MDLAGRLSNPPPIVETLAERGPANPQRPSGGAGDARNRPSTGSSGAVPEQEGRLSNPVQRRLSEHDIDRLVNTYLAGSSIDSLAAELRLNRTTIISHLDRRGIERRTSVRKMTDHSVRQAAKHYASGEALKIVADLGARHIFIKPHCPWQNGKVERFNRTLQTEWAYRQVFTSNNDRRAALAPWLDYYNTRRRHSAIGGLPPVSRLSPT